MTSNESQAYEHPLAREHLSALKALQAEGQTVGARGYHMLMTGFFHWGFVIYRCDYSDDALFDGFIAYLREQAERYHRACKQDRTTGLYLRWTIAQGREALDELTKDSVRRRFVEWRDGLWVERDGPGADHCVTPYLPRSEYCVHVGRGSLDSLGAHEEALRAGQEEHAAPPVFFAIVRAEQRLTGLPEGYDPDENEDEDEYGEDPESALRAIEGCTDEDVGWRYVPADNWVTLYEELHDDQAWYYLYARPPGIVKF
ncbi:hypothetical protein INS49_004059 [Diaporthe citri]|uniref:uncharacterized protein n=1 Tax=Diaporthe citri TaxID=83186 RepID=UPI001C81D684|nr:uncharacterized protein INS49_004059 [Diaporthe citri]KAG6354978.1 hypothetical protein INS49_004059 [Diaporthe citri]